MRSRRQFLATIAVSGITGLTGCSGSNDGEEGGGDGAAATGTTTTRQTMTTARSQESLEEVVDTILSDAGGDVPGSVRDRINTALSMGGGRVTYDGEALWEDDPYAEPITVSDGNLSMQGFKSPGHPDGDPYWYNAAYGMGDQWAKISIQMGDPNPEFPVFSAVHLVENDEGYTEAVKADVEKYLPAIDSEIGNGDETPDNIVPDYDSPEAHAAPVFYEDDSGQLYTVTLVFANTAFKEYLHNEGNPMQSKLKKIGDGLWGDSLIGEDAVARGIGVISEPGDPMVNLGRRPGYVDNI